MSRAAPACTCVQVKCICLLVLLARTVLHLLDQLEFPEVLIDCSTVAHTFCMQSCHCSSSGFNLVTSSDTAANINLEHLAEVHAHQSEQQLMQTMLLWDGRRLGHAI